MVRISARVVLIDPDGRVLLFRGRDPATPGVAFWFTAGGGVEAGESLIDAARAAGGDGHHPASVAAGGPVWRRLASLVFDGAALEAEEWFFLATPADLLDAGFDGSTVLVDDRN